MIEDDVRRIIKEELIDWLKIAFDSEYASGDNTKYTVKIYFRNELISSDYQIIKEGN